MCPIPFYQINLPSPACAGDPSLNLNLLGPTYSGTTPDPSLYTVVTCVADASGNILSITPFPNLTIYTPGTYSVCTFIYLTADQPLLPSFAGGYPLSVIQNDIANSVYCAALYCQTLVINDTPPSPILSLPSYNQACAGQSFNLSILNYNPAYNYYFYFGPVPGSSASGGAAITSAAIPNYTFTMLSGIINVCFAARLNGCSSDTICLTFEVTGSAVTPPNIIAPTSTCNPSTFTASIGNPQAGTNYNWTISGSGDIITPSNLTTVNIATTGTNDIVLCATANNPGCGTSTPSCVTITNANTDIDITVNNFSSPCDTSFSLAAVDVASGLAAPPGNWDVVSAPPNNTFVTFLNPNSPSTDVVISGAGGPFLLAYSGVFNSCSFADTFLINIEDSLTFNQLVSCNFNGTANIIITVDGGSPPITVDGLTYTPPGITLPAIPIGSSYSYIIEDASGCPTQVATGIADCPNSCISDAGTMSFTPIQLCGSGDAQGIHNANETLDPDDIGVFILHTNANALLGTIIDQNTTGLFTFDPNTMTFNSTYYISFVVGNDAGGVVDTNDPCLSVAFGQPVTWVEPSGFIPIQDSVFCRDTGFVIAILTNFAFWEIISQPAGSSPLLTTPNNPSTRLVTSIIGNYTLIAHFDNGPCVSEDTITLIKVPPVFTQLEDTCIGDEYLVTLTVTGGQPPYMVNGLVLADSVFTSPLINSNQNYYFEITDEAGCIPSIITGSKNCDCTSDAGSMASALIVECDTTSIINGTFNNDAALDPNDKGRFVLHDNGGSALGNIFAISDTPSFSFVAPLKTDSMYYISYIVGDSLPNGQINITDVCLDVSIGQPIQWVATPIVDLGPDTAICSGNFVWGPAQILDNTAYYWHWVGGSTSRPTIDMPFDPKLDVDFASPGNYSFSLTAAKSICEAADTITVFVRDTLSIISQSTSCINNATYYEVLLSSGDTLIGSFMTDSIVLRSVNMPDCDTISITLSSACICNVEIGPFDIDSLTSCDTLEVFDLDLPSVFDVGSSPWRFVLFYNLADPLSSIIQSLPDAKVGFRDPLKANTEYYVTIIVGDTLSNGLFDLNDPCLSIGDIIKVKYYGPEVIAFYSDTTVCGLNYILQDDVLPFGSLENLSSLAMTFLPIDSNKTIISVNTPGRYEVEYSQAFDICTTQDTFSIIFAERLMVDTMSLCLEDTLASQLTISITGGLMPYQLNNKPVSNIQTDTIANGQSIQYTISDAICPKIVLDFKANCPCNKYDIQSDYLMCSSSDTISLTNILPDVISGVWLPLDTNGSLWQDSFLIIGGSNLSFYNLSFIPDDPLSCVDSYDLRLLVQVDPAPSIINDSLSMCVDGVLDLNEGVFGLPSSDGTWYSQSNLLEEFLINSNISLPSISGNYDLLWIENNTGLCPVDTIPVHLNIGILPSLLYAILPTICGDSLTPVVVDITEEATLFINEDMTQAPDTLLLPNGSYDIAARFASGCEIKDSFNLSISPPIIVEIDTSSIDINTYITEAVINNAGSNVDYKWIIDGVMSDIQDLSFEYTVDKDLYVIILALDENGCEVSDTILLPYNIGKTDIYIPNVISLSSLQNNILTIIPQDGIREIRSMRVYDRWGNVVYNNNTPPYTWDGHFNGASVSDGIYLLGLDIINAEGIKRHIWRDITVLR